jgi:two-component system, NarL family, response regulator NreC
VIRVLVVDDHALVRAGIVSVLAAEADVVPVGEAGSVEQAIAQARILRPDVVLLDSVLPRRSGAEGVRDLLKVSPQSRILIVSAQAAPSAVREALSAGACGYVPKRAPASELLEAIRRVRAGERYVDPDLGAQLVVAEPSPALAPLTERETDVLRMLALGHTNDEIGRRLCISPRTVDSHRAHVMQKLGLETRAELVLLALSTGLIGPTSCRDDAA